MQLVEVAMLLIGLTKISLTKSGFGHPSVIDLDKKYVWFEEWKGRLLATFDWFFSYFMDYDQVKKDFSLFTFKYFYSAGLPVSSGQLQLSGQQNYIFNRGI
jgi:hypothetical protein